MAMFATALAAAGAVTLTGAALSAGVDPTIAAAAACLAIGGPGVALAIRQSRETGR